MDLVMLRRLECLESERLLNGRWVALCTLVERWTPQIEGAACEQANLYEYMADMLVRAAEQRECPTLSIVKPPRKVAAGAEKSSGTPAASDAG